MALTAKDWRHLALVTLIIAALPLLLYPNMIGLKLKLSAVVYILLELVYFFSIVKFLNRGKSFNLLAIWTVLAFLSRLLISTIFMFFLVLMEPVSLATAAAGAFSNYCPALLLFSLATPLLYNSTFTLLVTDIHQTKRKKSPVFSNFTSNKVSNPVSNFQRTDVTKATTTPKSINEYLNHSFDDATRHIGSYSGVLCALLIDEEGLPLSLWQRDDDDNEAWSGLVLKIIEDLSYTLNKASIEDIESLEFTASKRRFNMLRVDDMWLLAITECFF